MKRFATCRCTCGNDESFTYCDREGERLCRGQRSDFVLCESCGNIIFPEAVIETFPEMRYKAMFLNGKSRDGQRVRICPVSKAQRREGLKKALFWDGTKRWVMDEELEEIAV